MANVNKEAFERVCKDQEEGKELTFNDIGDIFGSTFWEMLVMVLLDAQDAARAVAGAISRLKAGD